MINTLTLDEAIEIVPAIAATQADPKCSNQYNFVSTRDILQKALDRGWLINNVSGYSNPYAQHRITMVHQNYLDKVDQTADGFPRIEMFNSHNRTKKLAFAIGYFRFACTNGLIIATGPSDMIRTRHRFVDDDKLDNIFGHIDDACNKFPSILDTIKQFEDRVLSEQEQTKFAEYGIKSRFLYRQKLPKSFADTSVATEHLLKSRRDEDSSSTLWHVFNRVQENIIKGVEGFSRPVKSFGDTTRVNQLLWRGATTALRSKDEELFSELQNILIKN
jgi:hypothetical protein